MIGLVRRIVVISVVVLALFACGVVLALAASGGESTPISKTQAVVYAHAVNLRPGDVPGMHSFGGSEANGQAQVVKFQLTPATGCGSPDSGEEFAVLSPVFRRLGGKQRASVGGYLSLPAEGLHSKVAVKQSAAEQERDFSAVVCDNGHIEKSTRSARHQVLPSPLPTVRVLGRRTWRTAPRAMFGTANVTVYSDRFSFVVGPAEIVLAVTSAPGPPHTERERRLVSLLYRRAEAHKL
jgi:hypothetical protein